jgi:hypothetical protein
MLCTPHSLCKDADRAPKPRQQGAAALALSQQSTQWPSWIAVRMLCAAHVYKSPHTSSAQLACASLPLIPQPWHRHPPATARSLLIESSPSTCTAQARKVNAPLPSHGAKRRRPSSSRRLSSTVATGRPARSTSAAGMHVQWPATPRRRSSACALRASRCQPRWPRLGWAGRCLASCWTPTPPLPGPTASGRSSWAVRG